MGSGNPAGLCPKCLIQGAFDGSVKSLVMQALATRRTSAEDLDKIEKLLDRYEEGEKK